MPGPLGLSRLNSQAFFRSVVASASLLIMIYVTSHSRNRGQAKNLADMAALQELACKQQNALAETAHPEGKFRTRDFVNGSPTEYLQDNLRNDTLYITTFTDAGWTNDVMTVANMIYLATITGRVAVVPPFSPSHIGYGTGDFPFGDFFDVPRLRDLMDHPVIEWRDIKDANSTSHEILGCWSAFATVEGQPRGSRLHGTLGVDVSHTKVPDNLKMTHSHVNLWGLAKLGFPQGRQEAMEGTTPFPSYAYKKVKVPDERFLCFDMLYYTSVFDVFEWEKDYSPVWRFVGQHLHFNPRMTKLAESYIRKAFGLFEVEPIPKFISIHARRGDFRQYCGDGPLEHCLAPLSRWQQEVNELRALIKVKHGISIPAQNVLMLSDEANEAWWDEVDKLGWKRIDHVKERSVERFKSLWYPSLIDAMLQAMGTGFLGTFGSTMSMVALRRTVAWNNGEGWMVRWGPGLYAPAEEEQQTVA